MINKSAAQRLSVQLKPTIHDKQVCSTETSSSIKAYHSWSTDYQFNAEPQSPSHMLFLSSVNRTGSTGKLKPTIHANTAWGPLNFLISNYVFPIEPYPHLVWEWAGRISIEMPVFQLQTHI